jgi:hypothetical protein
MAGTGQHNVALASATALTVPTNPNGTISATYASVCASSSGSTVGVRYTTDGTTPTSTVGQPLLAGQCVSLAGPAVLAAFKAIETGATATLDVEYFQ